jgi:hypothetical protein
VRRQNNCAQAGAQWTKALRQSRGCEFRRGLLDTVSVDALLLRTGRTDVKRIRPAGEIPRRRGADRELAQCAALANIRELDLCNDLGSGG